MTALLRLAWEGRKFAILLLVGGVAAVFYVQWRTVDADRAALIQFADLACEATGKPFRPLDEAKVKRGKDCLPEIRRLAKFEDDLKIGSLDALLADLERRDGKSATDAALAAAMAKRAADAAERMEQADADVEGDRVDGNWACAVNNLGGLRASGC